MGRPNVATNTNGDNKPDDTSVKNANVQKASCVCEGGCMSKIRNNRKQAEMKNTQGGNCNLCKSKEKTILIDYKSSTKHNGSSEPYIQVLMGLAQ